MQHETSINIKDLFLAIRHYTQLWPADTQTDQRDVDGGYKSQ